MKVTFSNGLKGQVNVLRIARIQQADERHCAIYYRDPWGRDYVQGVCEELQAEYEKELENAE